MTDREALQELMKACVNLRMAQKVQDKVESEDHPELIKEEAGRLVIAALKNLDELLTNINIRSMIQL